MPPLMLQYFQVTERVDGEVPCHLCHIHFDATAAATGAALEVNTIRENFSTGFQQALAAQGVHVAHLPQPGMANEPQGDEEAGMTDERLPLCSSCVRKYSIWGQVVAGDAEL